MRYACRTCFGSPGRCCRPCSSPQRRPEGNPRHGRPPRSHSNKRREHSRQGVIVWPPASSAPSPRPSRIGPRVVRSRQELRGAGTRGVREAAEGGPGIGVGGVDRRRGPGQRRAIRPGAIVYREVQQAEPEIGGVHEAIADLYDRAGKSEWATVERAKAVARRATARRRRPNAATWRASTSMSLRSPRVVPTRLRSIGRRAPITRWPPRPLRRSRRCRRPPKCTSCSRRSIAIRGVPPRLWPN